MSWVLPAALAVGQIVASFIGQNRQNKAQKALASHQALMNERYLQQQLEYNSPKSQMLRFQEAGLNPHLIYGQGNPGNQSTPLSAPSQGVPDYQSAMQGIVPLINQSIMTQSQVQALDAKTRQTFAMTELNKLQARVLAQNPLLDSEGFKAIIDSLKSTAEIKASQSGIAKSEMFVQQASAGHQVSKIFQEVQLLEQRFKLGTLDAKIKAEVVTSKAFQNEIMEIQKRFMVDGEVTPQHIMQFLQLLLMKMLNPGWVK